MLPAFRTYLPHIFLGLQSLVLLQFPLLNVLGLEYAAATAPVLSLLAGLGTISLLQHRLRSSGTVTVADLLRSGGRAATLSVVPLVFGLAASVVVKNCTLLEGAAYFLLIVPVAGVFGAALATAAVGLSSGMPRTLFVVLWALTLLHLLVVTFTGPQIFAFNPVVGYFPGFTYDDALSVLPILTWYRLTTLVLAVACFGLGLLLLDRRRSPERRMHRAWPVLTAIWLVLAAVWLESDRIGFSSSLASIERELGGVRRGGNVVLLYPADRVSEDEADRLVLLHQFHLNRIARTLRVAPMRPVVSVLYRDAEQKSKLTGGGTTNFTKPWLWQMHLTLADAERVVKHELVHVLAADFGFPLLRIGLNAGLIEGLAVAIERESYGMPLHTAAAVILRTRGEADLSAVFSLTGFFRTHASVSYTLAGSFVRHLMERYGVRRYKRAYASGSFASYGKPFEELVREWRLRIEGIGVTSADSVKAAYLFRRPPQFQEECYHFNGNLLAEARKALARGDDSLAVRLAGDALERTFSFPAVYLRTVGLVRLDRSDEALASAMEYRRRDSLYVDIPLLMAEGDARWGTGDVAGARSLYAQCASADLSDGWREAAEVRRGLIVRFPNDTLVRRLATGALRDTLRSGGWAAVLERYDGDPLLRYGLARSLAPESEPDSIRTLLEPVLTRLPSFLVYTARLRLAAAMFGSKSYERAKGYLWESQNDAAGDVRMMWIEEKIDWADFLADRTGP